jgi:hypothetical protein
MMNFHFQDERKFMHPVVVHCRCVAKYCGFFYNLVVFIRFASLSFRIGTYYHLNGSAHYEASL